MAWADDIQQASWRGVDFHVVSVSDTISRRVVEHTFPYRDGAILEDTGRDARPIRMEIIFFGPTYLTELADFLRVSDEGATGPLVHPLLGPKSADVKGAIQAKLISIEINQEQSKRESARLTVEWREDGTNTDIADFGSVQAAIDDVTTAASAAQTERNDATYLDVAVQADVSSRSLSAARGLESQLTIASNAVQAAIDSAETLEIDFDLTDDDLSSRFGEVQRSCNDAIAELQIVVAEDDDVSEVDTQPLTQSLLEISLNAQKAQHRAEQLQPQKRLFEVPVTMPVATIAMRLYGDPTREAEIIRLNTIRNPFFVPAGAILLVYAT